QGKIERFWQTLNKRLATRPADTLAHLQDELDDFRDYYNNDRPHRGIGRQTPAHAYQLIPPATPTPPGDPDLWRVRYDTVDRDGKISLRHSGRMLHLGIGRAHARTEITCLVHNDHATVLDASTGEILSEHTLNPAHTYQRKNG
ncbi:integrase core domain-containing protein, partial [Georgenia sp. Z1491]